MQDYFQGLAMTSLLEADFLMPLRGVVKLPEMTQLPWTFRLAEVHEPLMIMPRMGASETYYPFENTPEAINTIVSPAISFMSVGGVRGRD